MKRSLIVGLSLAVFALLVGTVSQAAPPGKVLVVAIAKMDIRTLDPHRQYEISPPQIMRAAYETLVTLGDQGRSLTKLEPLLAESYAISSDGKVYTFKLRKGVRFHTGGVMTADDVVFSFKRLGNLKDNPAWLFSDHVEKIEAADASTVRITLKEANAALGSLSVIRTVEASTASTFSAWSLKSQAGLSFRLPRRLKEKTASSAVITPPV